MDHDQTITFPDFDLPLELCETCPTPRAEKGDDRGACACDRSLGHYRIGATLGRHHGERGACRGGLFAGLRVEIEGAPVPDSRPLPEMGDWMPEHAELRPDEVSAMKRDLDNLLRCRAAILGPCGDHLGPETVRRSFERSWHRACVRAYQATFPHAVALGRLLATVSTPHSLSSGAGFTDDQDGQALALLARLHERHPDLDDLVFEAISHRGFDTASRGDLPVANAPDRRTRAEGVAR